MHCPPRGLALVVVGLVRLVGESSTRRFIWVGHVGNLYGNQPVSPVQTYARGAAKRDFYTGRDRSARAPDPLRGPAAPLSSGRASPIATGSLLAHQSHRVRELDDAAPASTLILPIPVARAAVGVRGGRGVSTW